MKICRSCIDSCSLQATPTRHIPNERQLHCLTKAGLTQHRWELFCHFYWLRQSWKAWANITATIQTKVRTKCVSWKIKNTLNTTVMYPERLDHGAGSGGGPDTLDHTHSFDGSYSIS